MTAIRRMKKTVNFLKAMKAARGKIVTQYEERMLVVHMTIAYGIISLIASFRNLILQTNMKRKMLTSLCTKKAWVIMKGTNE